MAERYYLNAEQAAKIKATVNQVLGGNDRRYRGSNWDQKTPTQLLGYAKLDATLSPGSSASATLQTWNGSAWADDGASVTVYDSWHRCFGLNNEVVPVVALGNGRWETAASVGLFRLGTCDSTITAGSSGTVSVFSNGSDSTVNVTAYLDHADGGVDTTGGKEIFIRYIPDRQKWQVVGAECE